LFYWGSLERQVRIEGRIEKISEQENDTYFHSRPLGSRQSACASSQSQPIANRGQLEEKLQKVVEQFGEQPPRPEHWGGYRLVPEFLEFWQGRSSRLHDRIAYTRAGDGTWQISRLQP
jgi:pyridoxamine 5'-phosphate oxidase